MNANFRILMLASASVLMSACGPSADTMQEAGATADARLASAEPAMETAGANVGEAAATAAAMAAKAGGTVASAAGDAGAAIQESVENRLIARVWEWQATTAGDGSSTQSPNPAQYTLTFAPGGAVAVMADCNEAGGTYDADDTGMMTLDVTVTTLTACGAGSLSDAFVEQVGQVTTWQVDETSLALGLASGGAMMKFTAR